MADLLGRRDQGLQFIRHFPCPDQPIPQNIASLVRGNAKLIETRLGAQGRHIQLLHRLGKAKVTLAQFLEPAL